MRAISLPLIVLKLSAAAALSGAMALLAIDRLRRNEVLASLLRDSRAALVDHRPPAILVIGFRAHGKSSFVNTACRALAAESGPLLFRAEAAPPGPTPGTVARHVFRAAVGGREEGGEGLPVQLVDAPPLPDPAALTREDVEAVLAAEGAAPAAECVVVVVRCATAKERHVAVKRLTDIATVVREHGLNLVVVLTHKKTLKNMKQAEELRKEVAVRARTDCVHFMENYTASSSLNIHHPTIIRNDFETEFTVLTIIRQCIEFAMLHRSRRSSNKPTVASAPTYVKEQ